VTVFVILCIVVLLLAYSPTLEAANRR